jgi:hypothetical protein
MSRENYKGYVIEANPRQLAENSMWTVSINIEKHSGAGVDVQEYSAANQYASKEMAIDHCLNFGRQIVNGRVGIGAAIPVVPATVRGDENI